MCEYACSACVMCVCVYVCVCVCVCVCECVCVNVCIIKYLIVGIDKEIYGFLKNICLQNNLTFPSKYCHKLFWYGAISTINPFKQLKHALESKLSNFKTQLWLLTLMGSYWCLLLTPISVNSQWWLSRFSCHQQLVSIAPAFLKIYCSGYSSVTYTPI